MPASESFALAQSQYKLQGRVLNSVTGQPIPRALVQLGEPSSESLLTGADGSFLFNNVPPGETILKAQKPGFLEDDPRRLIWSRPIEVGPQTQPVTIQLVPHVVIEGHVEAAAGDPPGKGAYATYRVLRTHIEEGHKIWDMVASGIADQEGIFHINTLPSGSYYVGVQARLPMVNQPSQPRYAAGYSRIEDEIFRPPSTGGVMGSLVSGIGSGGASSQPYSAVTYFAANPNLASGSPMAFVPGQQKPLVFSVKQEMMYKISGRVSGSSGGGYYSVSVLDEYGQISSASPRFGYMPNGAFSATVPAGKYVLRAHQFAPTAPTPALKLPELISEVALTVDADLSDLQLPMRSALSIPITVKTELTKGNTAIEPYANFRWVKVKLHPLDTYHQDYGFRHYFNTVAADGPLKIRDVAPGRYALEILPDSDEAYVSSAKCGSTDLLRDALVVSSEGPAPAIEIVVRDNGGRVAGTLKGAHGSSARVLIAAQSTPIQPPRIVSVDEHGGFESPELAPGDYRLFGFTSLDGIEYANPTTLDAYGTRAVHVKILPHGNIRVIVQANEPHNGTHNTTAASGN